MRYFVILAFLVILQSCSGAYVPSSFVVPAFDKAGEWQFSAAGHPASSFAVQAAHSWDDNLYAGVVVSAKPFEIETVSGYRNTQFEIIGGYYGNSTYSEEILDVFLPEYLEAAFALGYGSTWEAVQVHPSFSLFSSDREELHHYKGDYLKLSAQVGTGRKWGWIETSLGIRMTYVHFLHLYHMKETLDLQTSTYRFDSFAPKPGIDKGFVPEVLYSLRIGADDIKVMMNMGVAGSSNVSTVTGHVGMGLFARF